MDAIKEFEKELQALCDKYNVEQYVDYNKYACCAVIITRIRGENVEDAFFVDFPQ